MAKKKQQQQNGPSRGGRGRGGGRGGYPLHVSGAGRGQGIGILQQMGFATPGVLGNPPEAAAAPHPHFGGSNSWRGGRGGGGGGGPGGNGRGGRGGGHLAVRNANALGFDYGGMYAARAAHISANQQQRQQQPTQQVKEAWAEVETSSDEADAARTGQAPKLDLENDQDDSSEDVPLEPHRSYTHVVKPHLEESTGGAGSGITAAEKSEMEAQLRSQLQNIVDQHRAQQQEQQMSPIGSIFKPTAGATRRKHSSKYVPSFPAYHTSRPAIDETSLAAAGPSAPQAVKSKFRQLEKEGDAKYLGGIPAAYRAQLGLPPVNNFNSGVGGKFGGGSRQHFGGGGGFGGSQSEWASKAPIMFAKASGEWKNGVYERFDAAHGQTSQDPQQKKQDVAGDEEQKSIAQKAEEENLRLATIGKSKAGAGLGFVASAPAPTPASASAPAPVAVGSGENQWRQPVAQAAPMEIDLDALVNEVMGDDGGKANADEAAERVMREFPGSHLVDGTQTDHEHKADAGDEMGAGAQNDAAGATAAADVRADSEEEEEDEIILIPAPAGSEGRDRPGESDSEEERQLDAILAGAAQKAPHQSAAEELPPTEGSAVAAKNHVIDLATADEVQHVKADTNAEMSAVMNSMEPEGQVGFNMWLMDTTGDAPNGSDGAPKPISTEAIIASRAPTELTPTAPYISTMHGKARVVDEPIVTMGTSATSTAAELSTWNDKFRQPRGDGKKHRNALKKARRRVHGEMREPLAKAPRVGDSDLEWGSDGPPGEGDDGEEQGLVGDVQDDEFHGDELRRAILESTTAPQSKQQEDDMLQLAVEESLKLQEGQNGFPALEDEENAIIITESIPQGQRKRAGLQPNGKQKQKKKQSAQDAILADYMENALLNADESEEEIDSTAASGQVNRETKMDAMIRFMSGMDGDAAGRHVTLQDIEDDRRLQEEKEWETMSEEHSGDDFSEDDEEGVERAFQKAERELLSEDSDAVVTDSDSDDDAAIDFDDDDDDDDDDSEEDSDDGMFEGRMTWADGDEEFINRIQQLTATNGTVLTSSGSRKSRKELFRRIEKGDFTDLMDDDLVMDSDNPATGLGIAPAVKGGHKGKKKWNEDDLWAAELQAQWIKDRDAKAAKKKVREAERVAKAADPFHNAHGKKGKSKKATKQEAKRARRQARAKGLDSDEEEMVFGSGLQHATDLNSLNSQIQIFLSDPGKDTLSLPPMDKRSRAQVHMLADAYSLKSKSRGGGRNRFPILIKLARSGIEVDHRRVSRILSGAQGSFGIGTKAAAHGKGKDPKKVGQTGWGSHTPRNCEGAAVGYGADKIGAENVGHKLLLMMGWREGAGIGQVGGIAEPVNATVKITRGGLGF